MHINYFVIQYCDDLPCLVKDNCRITRAREKKQFEFEMWPIVLC